MYSYRVSNGKAIMLNGITEVLELLRSPHVHDEMTLVLRPPIRNPTGFLTQSQHSVYVFILLSRTCGVSCHDKIVTYTVSSRIRV